MLAEDMKILIILISMAMMLAGLPSFGLGDTNNSVADTSTPEKGLTSSQCETGTYNSSASTTITITMYTIADE